MWTFLSCIIYNFLLKHAKENDGNLSTGFLEVAKKKKILRKR